MGKWVTSSSYILLCCTLHQGICCVFQGLSRILLCLSKNPFALIEKIRRTIAWSSKRHWMIWVCRKDCEVGKSATRDVNGYPRGLNGWKKWRDKSKEYWVLICFLSSCLSHLVLSHVFLKLHKAASFNSPAVETYLDRKMLTLGWSRLERLRSQKIDWRI